MSRTLSPSTHPLYGLARVAAAWGLPRSTYYARRDRRNHPAEPRKRGPKTPFTDAELTGRIRQEIAASPFTGEGHRKFWARLRVAGVRTSKQPVGLSGPELTVEGGKNRSMSERFRAVDRDTAYLLPPSVQDWLPEQHLARFVVEVASKLDLHELEMSYAGRGSKAYHPEMLGSGADSPRELAIMGYGASQNETESSICRTLVRRRHHSPLPSLVFSLQTQLPGFGRDSW